MHVDHLVFAAGPEGIEAAVERLGALLGERFLDGGIHPRFGTRNKILPLADQRYLEVVEVLEHPAADKALFGQAVRARSEMGGGWLGWVVSVEDLAPFEQRLDRQAVPGSRLIPDGRRLEWEQIGIKGLIADPQLPYFLRWISDDSLKPTMIGGTIGISEVEIAGSKPRVEEWLGTEIGETFDGIGMNFSARNGQPGLESASFTIADGSTVRI